MIVVGMCAGSTALNKVDFGRIKGAKNVSLFINLLEVPRIEFKTMSTG
jgi:hypothetical protein